MTDAAQNQTSLIRNKHKKKDAFNILDVIGRGAFGEVLKVQDKESGVYYAMKVLSKQHITKERKINYVKIERDIMTVLNHPNIIRLYLTFQDDYNLYYVVELAHNGDLQHVLNKLICLSVENSRVILGQLLLAISHMHSKRIIHRDIKPENLLLDSQNRVKLSDFGSGKMFKMEDDFIASRGSFVGSADYVSPETLSETPVGPGSDLWSFGCLVYCLFVGQAPFHTESNYSTFLLIESCKYIIPSFVPSEAADLITRLLKLKPEERLGYGEYDDGYISIRNHRFFEGIDWDNLAEMPTTEFKPFVAGAENYKKNKQKESADASHYSDDELTIKEGKIIVEIKDVEAERVIVFTSNKILYILNIDKTETEGEIHFDQNTDIYIKDDVLCINDDQNITRLKGSKSEIESWHDVLCEYK